jgi:hypothetical protein
MLFINSLTDDEVLNSYNFARKSDFVYSEIISNENFKNIDKTNLKIIYQDEDKVFYLCKKFELTDNQVIFCNNYLLDSLFEILETKKELKNLKLITHQTDLSITRKLFNKKPQSISKWYSINVDYKHPDLVPIPIGLSNEYSPKNIFKSSYEKIKYIELDQKVNKIYMNFQKNTKFFSRSYLEKKLKNHSKVVYEQPNLNISDYLNKVSKYKFTMCPRGNGLDTHRIWETIYAGSIPVVEKLLTNEFCLDLPVIRYENLGKLDNYLSMLENTKIPEKSFSHEKLTMLFWINQIRKTYSEIPSNIKNKYEVELSPEKIDQIIKEYNTTLKFENNVKKIKTFLRKVYQKILDLLFD